MHEKINSIIRKILELNPEVELTSDTDLIDFHSDDLDLLEIAMCVEDKFGFEITDDQAYSIRKVKDIYKLVEDSKNN